ncbi:hypothetical protein DPMN_148780 [Dreissena polymorpha]|uniref:Uncharacterized protein n=1 Tax=Dreissena polymorpha TaxID=45954 RepID=A0A9D4J4Q1_DREPO|nr:hypothetical protein DPMN_148780 [Dreissena polymorpha]
MKVQRPPLKLQWAEVNNPFDKNTFTFYTKQGTKVARRIWPTILLTADRPLLSKGIAQGKE